MENLIKLNYQLKIARTLKAILAAEENWTKGAAARDKMSDIVYFTSEDATCFCFTGALQRSGHLNPEPATKLFAEAELAILRFASAHLEQIVAKLYWHFGAFNILQEYNDAPKTTFADITNLTDAIVAEFESRLQS